MALVDVDALADRSGFEASWTISSRPKRVNIEDVKIKKITYQKISLRIKKHLITTVVLRYGVVVAKVPTVGTASVVVVVVVVVGLAVVVVVVVVVGLAVVDVVVVVGGSVGRGVVVVVVVVVLAGVVLMVVLRFVMKIY